MKKFLRSVACFIGFHGESYEVFAFHDVPTKKCKLCGRIYEC